MRQAAIAILTSMLLWGCGGGDGNSVSPKPGGLNPNPVSSYPAPEPLLSADNIILYGDSQISVGQSVGFSLVAAGNLAVSSIRWQQESGPDVSILAATSQTIGFDVKQAGDHGFVVSGTLSNGDEFRHSFEFSASETSTVGANIRLDHTTSERDNVSLYITGNPNKTATNWRWRQVAGLIDVALESQKALVFFDAPNITQDTVVVIEGTVDYQDGTSDTDLSFILVKNVAIVADGFFTRNNAVTTTDMHAYNPDSPYADALDSCIYNNSITRSCSFEQLPLLGQINPTPDIDDIMDRVYVSHAWMGERFRQFLRNSATAPDMLKLLRATTAIVISYEVRPSFYWTATGAIYLDAANFWQTPEERDTLNLRPDFRSDFGNDLQFRIPWHYIKDNDYYIRNADYPRSQRLTKTFADMEASISWLMYHELGHANDFFPPTSWAALDLTDSPLRYAQTNEASSTDFANSYPLLSDEMKGLAQVSFAGTTATPTQKSFNAAQVASFFEPDQAPAYYSYSTIREDYAMLFERLMMLYRLQASADIAVTDLDDSYTVAWGQRDRVNDAKLQARTAYVVEQILPELDVTQIQQTLPAPQLMAPGVGYFEQLKLFDGEKINTRRKPWNIDFETQWRIDQHYHHRGKPSLEGLDISN